MLEQIDLEQSLSKDEFKQARDKLNHKLFFIQKDAITAKMPILLVFEGWDAAGKGSVIKSVIESLDARFFTVFSGNEPGIEEIFRPFMWKFWVHSPSKGEIVIFDESWYRRILNLRLQEKLSEYECELRIREILQFERQLSDNGTLLIKFWLHISAKEQKKRFEKIEKDKYEEWKVGKQEWKRLKQYKKIKAEMEFLFQRTSTHVAPWHIIPCEDLRFGKVRVEQTIWELVSQALRERNHQITDVEKLFSQMQEVSS